MQGRLMIWPPRLTHVHLHMQTRSRLPLMYSLPNLQTVLLSCCCRVPTDPVPELTSVIYRRVTSTGRDTNAKRLCIGDEVQHTSLEGSRIGSCASPNRADIAVGCFSGELLSRLFVSPLFSSKVLEILLFSRLRPALALFCAHTTLQHSFRQ